MFCFICFSLILGQKWRNIGELPHPVYDAASVVCGERILTFGGKDTDDKDTNYVQSYHTRTQDSCSISTLPYPCKKIITTKLSEDIYVTAIESGESKHIFKLTSDFGLTDAGFEFSGNDNILGMSHSEGNLVALTENPEYPKHAGSVMKVNPETSNTNELKIPNTCGLFSKPVHVVHRLFVDKRFLYHTYFCNT